MTLRIIAELDPTPCSTCDNVEPESRKLRFYEWRCMQFPVLNRFNPVDPSNNSEPPYAKCRGINHGFCPCWQPRREPEVKP